MDGGPGTWHNSAMTYDPFHSIADVHREPVRKALDAAFGSARVDMVTLIGGGASGAFPFRVEIEERQYLVRLEGAASPLRNPHQYESMRIASGAGIAPRVHHIDEVNRVAVIDFVEEHPLNTFPGGPQALASAVGTILGRVQKTPPFPRFVDYPEMVGRLWWWVCRTGLFAPGVLDPCTEHLAYIRETYVWDTAQSVSSHNDPVPRNILFDGQRLWLIDWESAYRNDPLVDVAITLDSFAPTPELEEVLLGSWIGKKTDASLSGRLSKVRALTRLYYAGVFLSASAEASGPLADRDLSAPTVAAFRRSISDGQTKPGSPEAKHTLGKMYLASFMTGDRPPGLDAAI
jgi:aminoglycoside phosphotransferase (APT) family kinase protein